MTKCITVRCCDFTSPESTIPNLRISNRIFIYCNIHKSDERIIINATHMTYYYDYFPYARRERARARPLFPNNRPRVYAMWFKSHLRHSRLFALSPPLSLSLCLRVGCVCEPVSFKTITHWFIFKYFCIWARISWDIPLSLSLFRSLNLIHQFIFSIKVNAVSNLQIGCYCFPWMLLLSKHSITSQSYNIACDCDIYIYIFVYRTDCNLRYSPRFCKI